MFRRFFSNIAIDASRPAPYPLAAMFSYCTKFGLLFACVAGIVGYVLAAPPSQVDGVLVLRNGYVLTGRIWQEGEVYVVKMKNGEVRSFPDANIKAELDGPDWRAP